MRLSGMYFEICKTAATFSCFFARESTSLQRKLNSFAKALQLGQIDSKGHSKCIHCLVRLHIELEEG